MNLGDYEDSLDQFVKYPEQHALWYLGLGIVDESGEVAGKIKKFLRDGEFSEEEVLLEIGDVLFYLTQLAHLLGADLEVVAGMNYDKLSRRLENGTISGSGDHR